MQNEGDITMIRRGQERSLVCNTNMRGGGGTVSILAALEPNNGEMLGKGRLFSTITLPPGASIGRHTHEGEAEAFLIVSGAGQYDDNGTPETVRAGDVAYCAPGQSHSVANAGECDLVMVALILYE